MFDINIERINLGSSEREEINNFLKEFELVLDDDVEYTAAAKLNDEIVGTCSFAGRVLKCFAVRENLQGEGVASKLITHVTNVLFDKGIYETFIFTKPKNTNIFKGLGYREVYSTAGVALLEGGLSDINKYVGDMYEKSLLKDYKKAALVMNCNPFTLGHRYLIERASMENEEVVVFIVEEDKSLFPFNVRFELVKRGTEDLKNVHVIRGGNYIISSNTFPSYFLREESERLAQYTRLDAGIFGKYIAPVFNINKRYVGTEPYCQMTNSYNQALIEVLPKYNIEVALVERLSIEGRAVSASEIRSLIRKNDFEKIKELVPEVTYDFLVSDRAEEIIEKIKRSDSPH